jgi:hypothetical protein
LDLFRLQLPQPWRSAQIETLRAQLFKIGARIARPPAASVATGWPFQQMFQSVSRAVGIG